MSPTEIKRIKKQNDLWLSRERDGRTSVKNGKFGTTRKHITINKSKG